MKSEEKICEYCGKEFIPARNDAKYCSASCKQSSYKNRMKKESVNVHPENVNLPANKDGFTDNANVNIPVKHQELTDNTGVNLPVNYENMTDKYPHPNQEGNHLHPSAELIPVNQNKWMVNPKSISNEIITFHPNRNVIDENLMNTHFDLSDYKRYKQYERRLNIYCGIHMKAYISQQDINIIKFIRIANHNLSSMIKFLFQCSGAKFLIETEIVNEFLKEIRIYMSSYKFDNLPLNYPYYDYFQYIKDKINLYVTHARMENEKHIRFKLTDKTKVDFEYILIDIDDYF